MGDIVEFPKHPKYDPVADLTLSIGELCQGEDTQTVLSALVTILIAVVADCYDPKGHAKVVDGVARLLKKGVAEAVKEVS
jgi:hypothetical protein